MAYGLVGVMKDMMIELKNLTINYGSRTALSQINGVFKKGSLTAITGQNGAGKSTLLKAIAGIIKVNNGTIITHIKANKISYLPQASEIERDFPLSVLHMVTTGYFQRFGGFCAITSAMQKKAIAAIAEVGLGGLENNNIADLSFGQFQRALFARLIIQDAELILLDEPFAAIDFETTIRLTNIIKKWHNENRTVICILHDIEHIRNNFHDCLVINGKCLAWDKAEIALRNYNIRLLDCHG